MVTFNATLREDLPFEVIRFSDPKLRVLEPFEFEKIQPLPTQLWTYRHQSTVLWLALVYLGFVFLGPKVMKDRKPFDLRGPLVLWNWTLALFSLMGFSRMAPTLLALVLTQEDGFYKSICA
jgi:hypothetical protein